MQSIGLGIRDLGFGHTTETTSHESQIHESRVPEPWFGTYLFPKLQAAGIKAIITIVPSDALAKLTARQWTRTGEQFGVEFIDTATLQTARQLAKQYAQ